LTIYLNVKKSSTAPGEFYQKLGDIDTQRQSARMSKITNDGLTWSIAQDAL